MTPHLEAKVGDYAEAILLPGDPRRAKWIAETFLDKTRQVNGIRNCLGFTGLWQGKPVSVQATGMGQPSTAIYVHELLHVYGAKTLIRVGTCGGLSTDIKVHDLILCIAASTDSAINDLVFAPYRYAPFADFELLRAAAQYAESRKVPHHIGGLLSADTFYVENPSDAYGVLARHGVLGVEMEAATLYTLAARFRARALAVCTMSDCLITGEQIGPDEREASLHAMTELALTVAVQDRRKSADRPTEILTPPVSFLTNRCQERCVYM